MRFRVRILAGKLVGAGAASCLNLRLLVAELNCQPLTSAVNLTLFAYTWMVLLPVAKVSGDSVAGAEHNAASLCNEMLQ